MVTLLPQTAQLCWFNSAQLPVALMLLYSAWLSPTQLPPTPLLLQLGSSGAWALCSSAGLGSVLLPVLLFVPLEWCLRLVVAVLQHRVLKLQPEGMGKGLTVTERGWVHLADPSIFSLERSSKMANFNFQCLAAPTETTSPAMMWVVWNKKR